MVILKYIVVIFWVKPNSIFKVSLLITNLRSVHFKNAFLLSENSLIFVNDHRFTLITPNNVVIKSHFVHLLLLVILDVPNEYLVFLVCMNHDGNYVRIISNSDFFDLLHSFLRVAIAKVEVLRVCWIILNIPKPYLNIIVPDCKVRVNDDLYSVLYFRLFFLEL